MKRFFIVFLGLLSLSLGQLTTRDGATLYEETWSSGSLPCSPNRSASNPAYTGYLEYTGCDNQPYGDIHLGTGGTVGIVAASGQKTYPWSPKALQIRVGTSGTVYTNLVHPVVRGTKWTWTLRFRPTVLVANSNYSHYIWSAGSYSATPSAATRTCALEARAPVGVTTYIVIRAVGATTSADTAAHIAVNTDHTIVVSCDSTDSAGVTTSTVAVDGGAAQTFQARALTPVMETFGYIANTVKDNTYEFNRWSMTNTSNLPGAGNGPTAMMDYTVNCSPGTTLTGTVMGDNMLGGGGTWASFTATGQTCDTSTPQAAYDGLSVMGKYIGPNGYTTNNKIVVATTSVGLGGYSFTTINPYRSAATWFQENKPTVGAGSSSQPFLNETERGGTDFALGVKIQNYTSDGVVSAMLHENASGNTIAGVPDLVHSASGARVYAFTPGSPYFESHTTSKYYATSVSSAALDFPLVIPGAVSPGGASCTASDVTWTQDTSGAVGRSVVFREGSIVPTAAERPLFVELVSGLPTQTDFWVGNSSGCVYYPGRLITGTMTSGSMFASGTAVTQYNGASPVATGTAMGVWGNTYGIIIIGPVTGTWAGTAGYTIKDGSGAIFTVNAVSTLCQLVGLTTFYPHSFNIMRLYNSTCQQLQFYAADGCPRSPNFFNLWTPGAGFNAVDVGSNYSDYMWGTRMQPSPSPTWTMPCK